MAVGLAPSPPVPPALTPSLPYPSIDLFQGNSRVRVDFLTAPTALAELGLDPFKRDPRQILKDDDDLLVIAYPSFNPNEMIAAKVRGGARAERRAGLRPSLGLVSDPGRVWSAEGGGCSSVPQEPPLVPWGPPPAR